MDKDKLFTPSLSENNVEKGTYDIHKYFYVAFFGGVIPLVGLATQSARQFKIDKKIITILGAVGALILIGKIILAASIFNEQAIVDRRTLNWIYKGASVVLYLAYYRVLRERFTIHISYGGELKPLFWTAVSWIFGAGVVETLLIAGVAWLTGIF